MRKFSIFRSAKSQKGELCTRENYVEISNSPKLLELCNMIAAEEDADKRGELKKKLPAITWQAYFPGRRIAKEAEPSGLFMLDIDHVEHPGKLYMDKVGGRLKELGIVYAGMTASRHGLRIVAKCKPELHSIEECQKWLASNLKLEYDGVCKDWARCSFLVHDSYTYFMDAKAIWEEDPATGEVYAGGSNPVQVNAEMENMLRDQQGSSACEVSSEDGEAESAEVEEGSSPDQREGLFGGGDSYKGIPYKDIIQEWFMYTGGEPTEGERNSRLYGLALRLRYITDFNEATMMRVMPRYGLPESEVREVVRHAIGVNRSQNYPKDLQEVLHKIDLRSKGLERDEEDVLPEITLTDEKMPSLPPVLRQWYEAAPADFKTAVTLCQLPILGTLGSRLRAKYLDGKLHSPSFQVSLEAPQASGKSFIVRLVEYELAELKAQDEENRKKEKEYTDRVAEMKLLNIKINADNKDDILGKKPQGIVRYVPATMSITKLLMRMDSAQGLHLFALAEEIDTVLKAFRRGFSSFSDALRVAFDNDEYGQDYASDQSWSGNIRLFYNCLFSGTPKAMRRFYPDVEDGLVSRVLFVQLPDQFGKPMPVWGEFGDKEREILDRGLSRLNEVSVKDGEVQPVHLLKMDWLNKHLKAWIEQQQAEAVRTDDRTRDIFCRRSAVVGFRAGMLAWFLWGEGRTPTIRRNVCNFAQWVANQMLNQHLLRFHIQHSESNTEKWPELLAQLGDTFTRKDLEKIMETAGVETGIRVILYNWKLNGQIESIETGRSESGKKQQVKFKKIKKS